MRSGGSGFRAGFKAGFEVGAPRLLHRAHAHDLVGGAALRGAAHAQRGRVRVGRHAQQPAAARGDCVKVRHVRPGLAAAAQRLGAQVRPGALLALEALRAGAHDHLALPRPARAAVSPGAAWQATTLPCGP